MATDSMSAGSTGSSLVDGRTTTSGEWGSTRQSWYLQPTDFDYSYMPPFLPDEIQPIQGDPKGAKYLVSYLFKIPKDPVVFLKDKKEMIELVRKLMADPAVDHSSIIVSKISSQFKPKQSWIKKLMRVEEIELKPIK